MILKSSGQDLSRRVRIISPMAISFRTCLEMYELSCKYEKVLKLLKKILVNNRPVRKKLASFDIARSRNGTET